MMDVINILPQENLDRPVQERVIVWLKNPPSSVEDRHHNTRSGLIRISTVKRLNRENKNLRKYFKFWMPSPSEIDCTRNVELEQMQISNEEFDDVGTFFQFIELCHKKCVIVVLSHHHAQDRELVSRIKKFRQIFFIYRYETKASYKKLLANWRNQGQSFLQDVLPRDVIGTRTIDLDEPSQLLLTQIFLIEIIVSAPATDQARMDFTAFCHSTYENDRAYETFRGKIEHFDRTYKEEDVIEWYTDPESFIYRIVNKVCTTLDIASLFKIRLILRDLYVQLQRLHADQLQNLLQQDITVYRGKMMSISELDGLKGEKGLFITRNFLSTSTDKDIAVAHSGEGAIVPRSVSVLICMKIDRGEMQDKPIAFIGDHSQLGSECEVMLPMGMVFRFQSYEEERSGSSYSVVINMVRGEDEKQIEKKLIWFCLLAPTGAGCAALGMVTFLRYINNGQHVEKYAELMSQTLSSSSPEVAEQLANIANNCTPPASVPNNPTNAETNISLNGPDNAVQDLAQQNTENLIEQCNVEINQNQPLISTDPSNINPIRHFVQRIGILQTPHAWPILATITALVVVSAIVAPLAIILSSRATGCPQIVCSIVIAVRDPSPNYQVEQLNLTCSETLSNMSIVQVVQRSFNETHAQQYQTFWNYSTNMTYLQTPTELIYYWYSLPGMHIVQESFPHFIEAQYYYTAGSVRNTSDDTWQISLESICGQMLNFSGTY